MHPHSGEAATLSSTTNTNEDMFKKRGGCCFWISWHQGKTNNEQWQRIDSPAAPPANTNTVKSWWNSGLKALTRVREWAAPRWTTLFRRIRRGGGRRGKRFVYDPMSYARNFDEGASGGNADGCDRDSMLRGFSARYASSLTSMDLGGGDAPPLFTEEH